MSPQLVIIIQNNVCMLPWLSLFSYPLSSFSHHYVCRHWMCCFRLLHCSVWIGFGKLKTVLGSSYCSNASSFSHTFLPVKCTPYCLHSINCISYNSSFFFFFNLVTTYLASSLKNCVLPSFDLHIINLNIWFG